MWKKINSSSIYNAHMIHDHYVKHEEYLTQLQIV